MQIQISWLLQKPTDLDLHCLQRQGTSKFSRTRVKCLRKYVNLAKTIYQPTADEELFQFHLTKDFDRMIIKLNKYDFHININKK